MMVKMGLKNVPKASINFSFITLLIVIGLISRMADALQCYKCGMYNDGVGSITPCLNYSESSAHLHLKECPRKTDKYCIVSFGFCCKPHLPHSRYATVKNLDLERRSISIPNVLYFLYHYFFHR